MYPRKRQTRTGTRHTRGAAFRYLAVLALLGSALTASPAAAGIGAGAATAALTYSGQAGSSDSGASPIDFVVLVDESGSIQPSEMADERAAAALLTESEISPSSQAAVIGFGSSNAPGQSAVDPVCPLTVLDTAGRTQMSTCVDRLQKRTLAQGQDTDFNSAISQALSTLAQDPAAVPKLIFMLTDGMFDVHNSPQYGATPADRQANGEKALTETLQQAAAQNVEIWPLGFGDQVDGNELAALARGGYQPASSCSAQPAAHTVSSSSVVFSTLLEAFAAARCGNESFVNVGPGTGPQTFTVTIPAVASEGSIVVLKHDPSAVLTFLDPQGRTVGTEPSAYGSTFEVSGQNSAVESLRITDPLPGVWTVKLSDPAGYDGQPVMAAIIWQGTLRSFITVSPPAPYAGQRVVVRVRLQTRSGVILDNAAELAGISVSATLTGAGFRALTVPFNDDGVAPDTTAYDGEFAGYLTVPAAASGSLTLVSDVTGQGVVGDLRPTYLTVLPTPPLLTGAITLSTHQINPGGSAAGTLSVHNADSKPHTVTFQLSDLGSDEQAQVVPPTVVIPAESQQQVTFNIVFAPGTPLGYQSGVITAVDKTAGEPVDNTIIDVRIIPVPDFWQQWKGLILVGAVVLILAVCALFALAARRRRGKQFGPFVLRLFTAAGTTANDLKVSKGQTEFGFTLAGSGESGTMLRRQHHGARWIVRRERPRGGLQLISPDGRRTALPPNQQIPFEKGFDIEMVDLGVRKPTRVQPQKTNDWDDPDPIGRRTPVSNTSDDSDF